MIKSFLKSIIFFIIFLYLFVAFLPKENLYYFGLEQLKKYSVVVKNETIKEGYFDFELNKADIFFKGINAVHIEKIYLKSLLFDTTFLVEKIKVDEVFKRFVPAKIDKVLLKYSIFNPLFVNINLEAKGIRGYGFIDILNKKLIINLKPSKKFIRDYKMVLKKLKKQSNGEYKIEYQF